MVASVAVLSDIHGVLPVLDAVLAEPDVAGADRIVVTGDHAAGPSPVEVLDRLVELGSRCILVRATPTVSWSRSPAAGPAGTRSRCGPPVS